MQTLNSQDPVAIAVTEAIRTGDLPGLQLLLAENPGLATTRITEDCGMGARSLRDAHPWALPSSAPLACAMVRISERSRYPPGRAAARAAGSSVRTVRSTP